MVMDIAKPSAADIELLTGIKGQARPMIFAIK
jgi:hypothetical protein